MKITVTSVMVDDQQKALDFYTRVLGFEKKTDIPLGGEHRWLTVVSREARDGVELALEPDEHPAAGRSRRLWSRTASRSRPSAWTTSRRNTSASSAWASASHSRRRQWAR